jgi:hypothetical protein
MRRREFITLVGSVGAWLLAFGMGLLDKLSCPSIGFVSISPHP